MNLSMKPVRTTRELKTTLTKRRVTQRTTKVNFNVSKTTTLNLKAALLLKKESLLNLESLCLNLILTERILKVRQLFLEINFLLLLLSLATKELMYQILTKFQKKKCKDLMQLRRSTTLLKIVFIVRSKFRIILKKVTKCLFQSLKNLRT